RHREDRPERREVSRRQVQGVGQEVHRVGPVILYKAPKSTFLGDLEESRIDQLLVEGFRDRLAAVGTGVRSAERIVSDC
ncbi:MAG: hypothetical protein RIS79_579, partial [Verrucomicrobiota bacterium]